MRALVEEDQIVELVLGHSLGPLLLLGLAATSPLLFLRGLSEGLGVLLGILFGSYMDSLLELNQRS
jgi:hypothetical protein